MGNGRSYSTGIAVQALNLLLLLQLSLQLVHGVEFFIESSRMLLRDSIREDVVNHRDCPSSQQYSLNSKVMVLAIPAILIFSCAFPWFRKRKEDSHTPLDKDVPSMDSASSFETPSTTEKVLPSPRRFPPPTPRSSPRPPPNKRPPLELTFSEAVKATQNFSSSCCIGKGEFGRVYKGVLPDGQVIAIKQARKEHFGSSEFNSEVEILSKIDHRNLVKFLGIVDEGNEQLIVTEYVPNGTLRQHLDGDFGKFLDFNQRLEISIDVAHGLTYLHTYAEKPIIHRDVKSSNILLTDTMRAKVADFGLARVASGDGDQTHISTLVKGTVGYLDPIYMRTLQLSTKSDVYSFGILLLEILSGRRPVESKRPFEERSLIKWAIYKYNKGNLTAILDPVMIKDLDSVKKGIVRKMFDLAFYCAAPERVDRPTMKEVGEKLWAIRMEYNRYSSRQ